MKNPQTKERPPLAKTTKDKIAVEPEKSGAPDIIVGHKRSPSAQRRRSQPGARRSQSREVRLSRGGSEVRESSVEMDEVVLVVRKFSSTTEQQKSVDRLSRVVTREKRTREGELKTGSHCHSGRSRSSSPGKRSPSIRRKTSRSAGGRARAESSKRGCEDQERRLSQQQLNSGLKTGTVKSQSKNGGEGAAGKVTPGSRSSSSGPTQKAKVLKIIKTESLSTEKKDSQAKRSTLKNMTLSQGESSKESETETKVLAETGIMETNGVVEESLSATEAIIRFESESAVFASSGVKSSVEVIGEICEGAGEATSSSKHTDATSMKSSSRPANGVKHITGISKTISANKENSVSSSKMDKKMTSSQEKAKSSSLAGAMALKRTLEGERGGVAMSSSETSSQSVAASNELNTAQKTQTVSRQTNLLKSSSKTKSVESSESSNSSSISKVNLVQSSYEEGGRTTMVVTLHPSQHKLCSFKEKKDSEDNWIWQAEMEPGQGKEVYGLQISFSALPRDVDVRVIRDTDAVEVKHEV